jgi:hypothetical protein
MHAATSGNSATWCHVSAGSCGAGWGDSGWWQRWLWLGTKGMTWSRRSGGKRRFKRGWWPG